MTPHLRRVASYGEPVFRGQPGPLWRHRCGQITGVDILDYRRHPSDIECAGCRGKGRDGWQPLLVYTGPLCDQCDGNGWVPISGKVDGSITGYDTVTECTACNSLGFPAA